MYEYQEGGIPMELILTGLAACAGGVVVSWVNYLILSGLLKSKPNTGIALASPLRIILYAAYLIVLYFIGKYTELNSGALLIGGALGLTLALAFFTLRLSRRMRKE